MTARAEFGRKELYAITLLMLINLFLFADQNLMAPNLTQIARDFGFSDLDRDVKLGGNISLVFWMLGGIVTLAIGYITDLISRRRLFIIVVLVGGLPCFFTGFAQNYEQLFWLRALTGIGIGGVMPITYSLIGDYFSHRNRAVATAWVGLAQGLGIAIGQLLAGFIGPEFGWRLPFIIVALPNFLLIVLFWITVAEPQRGNTEENLRELIESGQIYTGRINWALYRDLFKIKTNVLIFLQGLPGSLPWGVFFIFMNDFFSQDKGFSVEMATLIVMTAGASGILGVFFGGLIGNKLYNKKPVYLPLLCGATTLLGVIPTAFLLNYPSQVGVTNPDATIPIILAFITGLTVSVTGPNVRAITLNVNAPETRGSIFSLFNLVDSLGQGFGPVIISLFIVQFGRLMAFNITNLFWVLCGILCLATMLTFSKDEERLRRLLDDRAREMRGSR